MSHHAQAYAKETTQRPLSPESEDNPLDARQVVLAHLLGWGVGVLVILGVTAVVCVAVCVR